ncbi:MbcA/ParS/Xre antitoxin family protein [Vibrio sp. 10N.247.311.47]|uniref:MbcA/ParS/Xre antitoxin family protein n=1 Tax=Vibrio sp. 10N.247.311.47 TaxID=3229988 RepID=UPI0035502F79
MPHDIDETVIVAKAIVKMFTLWGVQDSTQLKILGMSDSDDEVLRGMRDGSTGLPNKGDIRSRARHLLTIHKYLRLLYPKNNELLYGWVKMHNKHLGGLTPLDLMMTGDFQRVITLLNKQVQH